MAASVDESTIARPFNHSLLHLPTVQIPVPLGNDFDLEKLQHAFERIQDGISFELSENIEDTNLIKCNRAQKNLLLIPAHLRERVMKAVRGFRYLGRQWRCHQSNILGPYDGNFIFYWRRHQSNLLRLNDGDCMFYWRSDGMIDGVKTSEQLVLNTNVDIRKRFVLACKYCLQESIQTLWTEMGSSGQTEILESYNFSMVTFWIRRLCH
ncbi:hypothetical protein AVEN_237107-1 [Araneus ventricosus]|uniref:Uncharacterized protein n=1 Tax=Araneus ventricosus TaxID=182803 RepID=A0A4Y2Q1V8_ARAVE|nr:hypothetical protein AVEN_237107-1 [Araneus ventricosus]